MPAGGSNLFGLDQFNNQTSFFDHQSHPTPVSWLICGGRVCAFFAILTLILVWFDIKFAGHVLVSENFQTAGRAIQTGLISVDVVSHWTWSITLLQSSTVGFAWGIAGKRCCHREQITACMTAVCPSYATTHSKPGPGCGTLGRN